MPAVSRQHPQTRITDCGSRRKLSQPKPKLQNPKPVILKPPEQVYHALQDVIRAFAKLRSSTHIVVILIRGPYQRDSKKKRPHMLDALLTANSFEV